MEDRHTSGKGDFDRFINNISCWFSFSLAEETDFFVKIKTMALRTNPAWMRKIMGDEQGLGFK